MIPAEKIIIALDSQDQTVLRKLFATLSGQNVWIKVGMEVFYALGPSVVHEAKEKGFRVFLDLKLHDIPNTVEQGIKSLLSLPVDMINIHAAGGSEMMKRASGAIKSKTTPPLLIAVTQLTSTTVEQMNSEQKISGTIVDSVLAYAKLAQASGCDGVVSSALEVSAIKAACGKDFFTVTPGIRLKNSDSQDQKRVTTPREAIVLGADFLVIGRPITTAADPSAVLKAIISGEIE